MILRGWKFPEATSDMLKIARGAEFRSGSWRCDWIAEINDKTWMDEDLVLMNEQIKGFLK